MSMARASPCFWRRCLVPPAEPGRVLYLEGQWNPATGLAPNRWVRWHGYVMWQSADDE